MQFDFTKFIASQDNVKELVEIKESIEKKEEIIKENEAPTTVVEMVEVVEETVEEVVTEQSAKRKSTGHSWEDKIDKMIEELKGTPKLVYEDLEVKCIYMDDTDTITIINKLTDEEYSFKSEGFFERAVFETNTRAEKYQIIIDKFKEITGRKITQHVDTSIEEVIDTVIDIVEEDIHTEELE